MICPICKFKKIKSIVKPHGGSSTAMYCSPYYDENGNYHNHDLNIISESYSCSNSHHWVLKFHNPCPHKDCDFNILQKQTIMVGANTIIESEIEEFKKMLKENNLELYGGN